MVKCANDPSVGELKVARALHAQCAGCDCQHKVPKSVIEQIDEEISQYPKGYVRRGRPNRS